MSLIYSGLSVGIAFGFVSGAIFLIGNTFYANSKGRRRLRSQGQQRAADGASGAASCPCSVGGGGVCAAGVGALERRSHASLRCSLCGGVVCRACSRVVRPSARIRLCDTCYQHRELTNPSGDWFYRQLQTKFHDVTPSSSSESSLDASLEVREFIERLTENLVGGSVDDVTVEPLSSQTDYEQLCTEYHPRMQDVLTRLAQALQFAITDLSTAKLAVGGSPSEIHVQLKRTVSEMREKALQLPLLEMDSFLEQEGGSPLRQKPHPDFGKRTYEDLLSTAIINKVVEGAQCDLMEQHLKTPACPTGDSIPPLQFITCMRIGVKNWKDKNRRLSKSNSPKRRQKIPQQTATTGADSWDSAEESDNDDEDDDDVFSDAPSDNESRPPSGKCSHRRSSDMDQFFANLKYCNRVPFPELGADVVEGSVQDDLLDETARTTLYLVHSDSHHSSLSSQSWEENWLFQKKRLKMASSQQGSKGSIGRVPMLVPKPKDEHRHLRAKVGDTDADQLSSDLSDYENYMSSRNDVSSEEGDREPTSLESVDRQEAALKLPPDLIEATNQEMQGTVVGGTTLVLSAPSVNGNESHEFDQQEGEYLEDFASVGHRSLNSLHGDSNESSMPGTPTNETVSSATKTKNVPDILESTNNAITPSPTPSAEEKLTSKPDGADDHLFKPPMPGTLAAREHLKWQQARPMPNNPYSEENIIKRLDERKWNYIMPISSASHSNAPAASPRQLSRDSEEPVRINCSGDGVRDIKKYGRDYYINQQESRLRKAMDAANDNANEVTSSRTSSSVGGICSSQPSSLMGSTDDLISEIESLPMPSVKELTKHFDAAAPELIQKRRRNRAGSYDKEVIIIENLAMPVPVHSLTGRNLSKDVKASLRGEAAEAPKPAARQLANLEFWRRQQQGPTPVPAPRKK